MRHTKQREQGGKKENGIGRNRELAQGDAQWSRSTLVPSRRQAKHRHRTVCSPTCRDAEHEFQKFPLDVQ